MKETPFAGGAAAQSLFHNSPQIKPVVYRQSLGISLGQEGRGGRNKLFLLVKIQQLA